MTAYRAVIDRGRVQPGQWLAVHGCGSAHVSLDAVGRAFTFLDPVAPQAWAARAGRDHLAGGTRPRRIPVDMLVVMEWDLVGSLGNPHPRYAEVLALVAHQKLHPARLVTREIALGDVTNRLERVTRFDTVGFEVITRFT